jgi:hypothetical protein
MAYSNPAIRDRLEEQIADEGSVLNEFLDREQLIQLRTAMIQKSIKGVNTHWAAQ